MYCYFHYTFTALLNNINGENTCYFVFDTPIEASIQMILCLILIHMNIIISISSDLQMTNNNNNVTITTRIKDIIQWLMYNYIYFRTNLLSLSYKQQQARLHKMGIEVKQIQTFSALSPRKHWSTRLLFIMRAIGGLSMVATVPFQVYEIVATICWIYMFLMAIIIFIALKIKRVKDAMGCLYEIYLLYFLWIYSITLTVIFNKYEQFINVMMYTNDHIIALFTLFFSMYLIKMYKGSLKYPIITDNEKQLDIQISSVDSNSVTIDTENKTNKQRVQSKSDIDMRSVPLEMYLCERQHYELFSKYLALHFCTENLIFIERVNIFRWCILKKMSQNPTTDLKDETLRKCYSMKFEFLDKIYKEYTDITDEIKSDSFDKTTCDALLLICKKIYKECIADDGEYQINIPYNVRGDLDNKFKTEDNGKQTFESYDEFLNLFNDAVNDIWDLLQNVYRFKFKSFLQQNQ